MLFTFSILTIVRDRLLSWIDSWLESVCPFLCFHLLLCCNVFGLLITWGFFFLFFFQSSEGKEAVPKSCWEEDSCINQQGGYECDKCFTALFYLN